MAPPRRNRAGRPDKRNRVYLDADGCPIQTIPFVMRSVENPPNASINVHPPPFAQLLVKVYFPDDSTKMFGVANDDAAGLLLDMIHDKLDIQHRDVLRLRLRATAEDGNRYQWLDPELPLFAQHVTAETALMCEPQVIVMTPQLLSELDNDPALLNILYHHCRRHVLSCHWPVAERCAVELGALQIHADHGNYNPERHRTTFLRAIQPETFLPFALAQLISEQYWQDRVFNVYKCHPEMSLQVAKYRYVTRIAFTPYFGAAIIEKLMLLGDPVTVGVTADGIIVMRALNNEALKFIHWRDLSGVYGNGTQLSLKYRDTDSPTIFTGQRVPELHRLVAYLGANYQTGMLVVRPPPREFSVLSDMRSEIIKTLYVKKSLMAENDYLASILVNFDDAAEHDMDLEEFALVEFMDRRELLILAEAIREGYYYKIPVAKLMGRGAYAFRHNWHVRTFTVGKNVRFAPETQSPLFDMVKCCPELEELRIEDGSKLGDKLITSLARHIIGCIRANRAASVLYTRREDLFDDEEDEYDQNGALIRKPPAEEIPMIPFSRFSGFTLFGNKFSAKGVKLLFSALEAVTNIWGDQVSCVPPLSIGLDKVKVDDWAAEQIYRIGTVRGIRRLILRDTKITPRSLQNCLQVAVDGGALEVFDMSDSLLGRREFINNILPLLQICVQQQLAAVRLSGFSLNAKEDTGRLRDFFSEAVMLKHVDLSGNKKLKIDGLRVCLEALAASPGAAELEVLMVGKTGLEPQHSHVLADLLAPFPSLAYLDVTNNGWDDAAVSVITDKFPDCTVIRKVLL